MLLKTLATAWHTIRQQMILRFEEGMHHAIFNGDVREDWVTFTVMPVAIWVLTGKSLTLPG